MEETGDPATGSAPSPCIKVCRLDERTKLCVGCLRTAQEIGMWRDADDAWRRHILELIRIRRSSGVLPLAVD
ncbi:MAG: DUF1289 domain-containing protein [Defluviicoccus sp.]|nr:MAG: DUF1289 domain-containing protein [Defluviicoccus sp.]